jgi:hypothetical protein
LAALIDEGLAAVEHPFDTEEGLIPLGRVGGAPYPASDQAIRCSRG